MSAILASAAATAQVPHSKHVVMVVEENHSYESVAGHMSYLNSLAAKYGLATASYANSHYSIPNYMWLTAGRVVTQSDNTRLRFNVDNIVRYFELYGKSWKSYQESLPYIGYVGYNTGSYVERHDPFAYFTDVAWSSSERNNIVPFTHFAADLANGTLPDYSFITPNLQHDGHNGTLAAADGWLKQHIAPLLASPDFQRGGDGLLIVTFDESYDNDCRPARGCPALPENLGGGRIYTVIIGPKVKHGYRSAKRYMHPSILRTMMEALGMTTFPGAAATAPDLGEFFTSVR